MGKTLALFALLFLPCTLLFAALEVNPITGKLDKTGSVGLGTTGVNSGVAGFFTYYPSTGPAVDDQTVMKLVGSNVGIGTALPGAALETTRLQVRNGATSAVIELKRAAAQIGDIGFSTVDTRRWTFRIDGDTESGSNFGSRFIFIRNSDAGSNLGTVLEFYRNDGRVIVTNNLGIGTTVAAASLAVHGNVFIDTTSGKLIGKSPDGTCSSLSPDNSDAWAGSSVACP